jgi:hypothetical protein
MERRLLRILGIVGLVIAGFLFVARIRVEPLPSGIRTLFRMKAEDPANTRLAQATEECVASWWDLRNERDRAELTTIIILTPFSVATLIIAWRLPRPASKIKPHETEDLPTPPPASM